MAPGQRPQERQRFNGNNAQATLAMVPMGQRQGCQRCNGNVGNSTSTKTVITPVPQW
jgi:hypothetical protein